MPNVRMPDGTVVRFPDDMPREEIRSFVLNKFPDVAPAQEAAPAAPAPEAPQQPVQAQVASQAGDIARSFGEGARTGAEGVLGIGGDARQLGGQLIDFVMSKMGADEQTRATARQIAETFTPLAFAPTTEQVRENVTDPLLGAERHTPQTTAGEFARTGGEFLIGAAAPGGVARKAAMVAAPALASEGAGQAARAVAPELETPARIAGALAGGVAAAGRAAGGARAELDKVPGFEQIRAQTRAAYQGLTKAGIEYDPNAFAQFVQRTARDAKSAGFRPKIVSKAYSLIDDLADMIGKPVDFDDLDSVRKAAGEVLRLTGPDFRSERTLARRIIGHINDFERAAPLTKGTLTQSEFNSARKEARELASRKIKAQTIIDAIDLGKTRASGADTGIRRDLDKLIQPKNLKRNHFTQDEIAAVTDAAKGNFSRNVLFHLARFGIDPSQLGNTSVLIPALTQGGAIAAGDALSGTMMVGLGTLSKLASRQRTTAAADRAVKTALAGRSGQKAVREARRLEGIKANIRRLITLEPTARTAQPVDSLAASER